MAVRHGLDRYVIFRMDLHPFLDQACRTATGLRFFSQRGCPAENCKPSTVDVLRTPWDSKPNFGVRVLVRASLAC